MRSASISRPTSKEYEVLRSRSSPPASETPTDGAGPGRAPTGPDHPASAAQWVEKSVKIRWNASARASYSARNAAG